MPHPLLLELMVQERQLDLERERKHIQLLAQIPKSCSLSRLVAGLGAYLVNLGTWMQRAESGQAEPSKA